MASEPVHVTSPAELERVVEEQAALRRVATLVAAGAREDELVAVVTSELGRLFGAQRVNAMRWDGDTFRVIGDWSAEAGAMSEAGDVYAYGGDTITARIVETAAPARIDSADDLQTAFAQERWRKLGLHASIGAPIEVDGRVWGVVTASRTRRGDVFPPGAEQRLRDFAALVAQSIVNAEARRETAELVAEQSALRRVATLVAGGKPQTEVLTAVMSEVGALFGAASVAIVRWEGVLDEVVVVAAWNAAGAAQVEPGSLYHPSPGGATLRVLETGVASSSEESSPERGAQSVIGAPVIVKGSLLGALTASRPADVPFPAVAAIRLRSFADLASQSIANERAEAELRASRARIVRTADETRARLERNLHDGAQQHLVAASIALRLATAKLTSSPAEAGVLVEGAAEELSQALDELRDLARGLHPAILTQRGLVPAVGVLVERSPIPVDLSTDVAARLPTPVEAAVYYVASEALTNVAKHAGASRVELRIACAGGTVEIVVADDGAGGAEIVGGGSGLQGLADRVEALGGTFAVESAPGEGTRVRARMPLATDPD